MERLKKVLNQMDDSVLPENLIKMSREHGVLVTIRTIRGDVYTGTLMCGVPFNAITTGVWCLYIRLDGEGGQSREGHAVVPVSSIDSLTFNTEKGLLDNLVK